jgi:hypothetical protein
MMFASNARAHLNETPCPQNLEWLARDKHSSLSQAFFNHGCKALILGPCMMFARNARAHPNEAPCPQSLEFPGTNSLAYYKH